MKTTYEIDGKSWIKISDAARLLKTNAIGIRKLMGDGRLEWHQSRANSRTLVVDRNAVIAMVHAKPFTMPPVKPMKGDRLKMSDKVRRERGGLWTSQHLRLTLPPVVGNESEERKKVDPGSSPG